MTRNSSILFMAPMKKMMRSCVIAIVMILQRKMGEQTELRNGGDPSDVTQGGAMSLAAEIVDLTSDCSVSFYI